MCVEFLIERRESLKHQVKSAFSHTQYPGDDRLVSHDCPECNSVAARLKGKHWTEVDRIALFRDESQILLLTPEAHLFYLPAYMLGYLDDPNVGDYWTVDLLTPPPNYLDWPLNEFLCRYQYLSGEQVAAIAAFVELLLECFPLDFESTMSILTDFWVHRGCMRYGIGGDMSRT